MPSIAALRSLLPALAGLAFAGCATSPAPERAAGGEPPQRFQCGDAALDAWFRPGEVELALDGRRRVLPAVVSASGARYVSGADVFWSHGAEATLTLDGVVRRCQVVPVDPWRQARLRGVDFRAVGQEPGWLAELGTGPQAWLDLQLDYGARTLRVAATRRLADAAGVAGEADGEPVELRIRPQSCVDTMSGEAFEATVELRVGDRRLAGCGRFLAD